MKILFIIIFTLFFFASSIAQDNKSYKVNSIRGDSGDLIHSTFKYPGFTNGQVLFKNQPLATASLNYNFLSGQILFETQKGETLEIARPETLKYVVIGIDTFYYFDKGYAEMITHFPSVNLAKKQTIKFNGKEKKGAYGTYSGTTAASSINTYSDENVNQKIPIDENTLYAASTQFYISDKTNNFFLANKKNFFKLFSDKEKALSGYLDKNTVHFNKEEDLRKLLDYLKAN